jgi:hypothetical protein
MLGDHDFGVEALRRSVRNRPAVARHRRQCRFCGERTQASEDEMHALFEFVCTGSSILILVREAFLAKVQTVRTGTVCNL